MIDDVLYILEGLLVANLTALPSTADDGEEIYIQNAAMATAGVMWKFRYNAASVSAYPWEFVSGSAWQDRIITSQTTASATFTDLATVGPTLTLPLAGEYRVDTGTGVSAAAGIGSVIGVCNNGVVATNDIEAYTNQGSATAGGSPIISTIITVAAASTVVKLQYEQTGTGTPAFRRRWMNITPIRVG